MSSVQIRSLAPIFQSVTSGSCIKAIQAGLALGISLCAAALMMQAQADDAPPAWAYPVNPPDFKGQPDDGTSRHVPDSTAAFTVTQARDLFFALDWHPSDHLSSLVAANPT